MKNEEIPLYAIVVFFLIIGTFVGTKMVKTQLDKDTISTSTCRIDPSAEDCHPISIEKQWYQNYSIYAQLIVLFGILGFVGFNFLRGVKDGNGTKGNEEKIESSNKKSER